MISVVVLAAGKSSRMQGSNKLLATIEGQPLIRKVVQTTLESKADEVIIVVGWEAEKIRAALLGLPCRIAHNRNHEHGQSSSVKVGLSDISQSARAVLILPGDVALIDARSINIVIEKYALGRWKIVIAGHQGKSGHPSSLTNNCFRR